MKMSSIIKCGAEKNTERTDKLGYSCLHESHLSKRNIHRLADCGMIVTIYDNEYHIWYNEEDMQKLIIWEKLS